jgi:beta-lactam-binding protein with PASTA domain
MLESVGLKLDRADVPEMDSNEAKGKVAWQEIDAKTKVAQGTVIKVKRSNGAGARRSAIVTVPLPNTGAEATVRVYLDGALVKEEPIVVGSSYTVTVEGNAPAALEVRLNGRKAYTATVNFDLNPPTLTEERTHDARPIVPSVVGLTEERAVSTLNGAGYDNVTIDRRPSVIGFVTSGMVAEQSPPAHTPADLDTEITITVIE